MKTVLLSDVAEVFNGKTPSKAEQRTSGHPVLKIKDLNALGEFRGSFESFVEPSLAQKHQARWARPGDTVILNAAHNASHVASKAALLRSNVEDSLLTGEWLVVRPGDTVDARYVHYWLTWPAVRASLKEAVKGIHLYPRDVACLQMPLPPLPEQRRIAAILDHADALRAKRRQILTHLDSLAQSLYEWMLGGGDWPLVKISAITSKVGSGATPRGGQASYQTEGVALIRSMNVHDGKFVWKDLAFLDDQQATGLRNVVVEADDVLLNITGASVARVSRAPASVLPARVNQHVAIIRPKPATLHPRILERHLMSPRTKRSLLNVAGGGATREAITKAQILNLEVPMPDVQSQDRYLAAASRLERHRNVASAAIEAADSLFISLQSRAFRGEL